MSVLPLADRVAIVSYAGRFPGAADLSAFWSHLRAGTDCSTDAPAGRWVYAADGPAPDRVDSRRGYFLDTIPLDPAVDPTLDLVFHLTVGVGRQAWQRAQTATLDPQRVGVILGHIALPTDAVSRWSTARIEGQPTELSDHNRYVAGLPAGLLAQALGLGGGSVTLDAACASSLYAVKLGMDELLAGRADAMVVGGVARPDCLYTQMGFTQLKALAKGRCAPFDAAGSGLVVGEGAGVFVLKRLRDALAAGDRIYATIAGAGLSNDQSGSLLAPESAGQLRAMRAAYAQAGWQPADVDLIECHATGTPLGDATEFASLLQLWQGQAARPGQCVLGSVKSNVGHLLTGANAAGLAKVLLALEHATLPPTANFSTPAPGVALAGSPFRILRSAEPWQPRTERTPRRAALSGFGFGGINAHLLIEDFRLKIEEMSGSATIFNLQSSIAQCAIVGMDARCGGYADLTAFQEAVFADDFRPGVLATIATEPGQFRIPPKELADLLPQQLLLLHSAAAAVRDAGELPPGVDIGVFVGTGLDVNTTNFHYRWQCLNAGREPTVPPLTPERVLGALASIAASRVARTLNAGGPAFTLCSEDASGARAFELATRALERGEIRAAVVGAVEMGGDARIGQSDGAACVVLMRADDATRLGKRIYAQVADVSVRGGPSQPAEGAAGSLRAIVRAALCLHHEIIPNGTQPQYWLHDHADGPRRQTVTATSVDGNVVRVTLAQGPTAPAATQPLGARPEALFAVSGATTDELRAQLDALAQTLPTDGAIEGVARRQTPPAPAALGVACVARTIAELRTQLQFLRAHLTTAPHVALPDAERNGPQPALRDRVFYTPTPLGPTAPLAFVYPGSGNHFAGMGRDLGVHWPTVLRRQQAENRLLRSQYAPHLFWDQPPQGPVDARATIFGQVTLGTLTSDLLVALGVRPSAVVGLSLGESAGLFGMRAWQTRDEMFARVRDSSLFVSDLAGRYDALRTAWQVPHADWLTGVVTASPDAVRAALVERTYLLIINAPNECVLGGERAAVQAVAQAVGGRFLPLEEVTVAHCAAARPVESAYRALHTLPTTPPAGVRYYSGTWRRPFAVTDESVAETMVAQLLNTIDYPALIEQVYADGVRGFVDVGPGAASTRLIAGILGERPHLTRAVCVPRADNVSQVLRLLAALHAQRIPFDWAALYGQPSACVGHRLPTPPNPRAIVVPAHAKIAPAPARRTPTAVPSAAEPTELLRSAERLVSARAATASAHAAYLQHAASLAELATKQLAFQTQLIAHAHNGHALPTPPSPLPTLTTEQCYEFAVGSIAKVLGPAFAEVDTFPTRVRLPDHPLMLVDRVLQIDGEPLTLTHGRVVTEHDVHAQRWYLDAGKMPTCVTVEAGQADLFLAGYLGIDLRTRGLAVYRLLDAVITFQRGLPVPGETIHYDIRIKEFFRQGDTYLFRFEFDGSINGQPLLTMRSGCAGFFSAAELAAGKGVVQTALQTRPQAGVAPDDWRKLAPLNGIERYSAGQIECLLIGDLVGCFGPAFAQLPVRQPQRLPGGHLRLVHRVAELDPHGGRFGLGQIRAEADIHGDDWFLTCHFVDDQVMPGTLMYECCLHTLRILLMRVGWVGEHSAVACEPVPGIASRLKCRGQVIASTKLVTYQVSIKEVGYNPAPYVLVEALMFADGKPVVEITDMSLQLTGLTQAQLQQTWTKPVQQVLFPRERITAFAIGKPSEAFGDRYRVFDAERTIARLPGPPYQFLDRIVQIQGCAPWQMQAGGTIVAEYDVPPDEWYFAANRMPVMPFAVLLEVALQPCGWLAAYVGSALTSPTDLSFRNLGGSATQYIEVGPHIGTLSTTVTMTKVSSSGGMIIQHYDYTMYAGTTKVYAGNTYFGFFSKDALANQIGIRDAQVYMPPGAEAGTKAKNYPNSGNFPDVQLRMVDTLTTLKLNGGPHDLGYIVGTKVVNPQEWFFAAHFYQDPVIPGSLGLESFLQLLKAYAAERWGAAPAGAQTVALGCPHEWVYRGQVVPRDRLVTVSAVVTAVDDAQRRVTADGFLQVDGRTIYQMKAFTLQQRKSVG
jgi:acyl transferase domain-containing protein/3-hydroxymyristoyl/3-hydroxydecanoyl-(acyl carrier protein) dehydratase